MYYIFFIYIITFFLNHACIAFIALSLMTKTTMMILRWTMQSWPSLPPRKLQTLLPLRILRTKQKQKPEQSVQLEAAEVLLLGRKQRL